MKTESKSLLILDTNTLLSAAILPKSFSAHGYNYAIIHFTLVFNTSTWEEINRNIYLKKFDKYLDDNMRKAFIAALLSRSIFVEMENPTFVIDCTDLKDNKFLSLAIDTGAKILVTGDDALLRLNPWRGVTVCTLRTFLENQNAL